SVREKNGLYYAKIKYRDATGQWRERWGKGHASRRKAVKEERALLARRDRNESIERDRETVAEFLRRWLAFKRTEGTAPRRLEGYEDHIEKRWIPAIGHKRMTDLYAHPAIILDAQTEWLTNGVEARNRGRKPKRFIPSTTTMHHYRATLAAALEDNRHWHNDQVPNPSRVVGNIPPLDAEEVITLDAGEARALVAACEASTDMRAQVVAFALFHGHAPRRGLRPAPPRYRPKRRLHPGPSDSWQAPQGRHHGPGEPREEPQLDGASRAQRRGD